MEAFVLNVAKPRETLEQFNERVAAYCAENPVVDANVSMLGPSLLVSLTHADDVDANLGHVICPVIYEADGLDDELEDKLTKLLDTIHDMDTEDDPHVVFNAQAVHRPDFPAQGFVVFTMITGGVEIEDEDADQ